MKALERSEPISIDNLYRELGSLTDDQERKIKEILLRFMYKIRMLLLGSPCLNHIDDPLCHPHCATCIFNPAADVHSEFSISAFGLLLSLVDIKAFVCNSDHVECKLNVTGLRLPESCRVFRPLVESYCFEARQVALNTRNEILLAIAPQKEKATR